MSTLSQDERHLYARLGGGSDNAIHCAKTELARPAYLHFGESSAQYCEVYNSHQGKHRLFYEVHGNGSKKLLSIRGLSETHAHFEPQLKYFGIERGEEYTVCVVDNRGTGYSDTPAGRWRTTDIASDCLQLLDHLQRAYGGWKSDVNLIGFSLGGMVCQELLLMAPKRFNSVALISTHAGGVMGTIPPVTGVVPFFRTCSGFREVDIVNAGLELLFPRIHLEEIASSDRNYGDYPPSQSLTTNRDHYAYLFIRRSRKYIEAGLVPEFRFSGILHQIAAIVTHHISWARLERMRSYQVEILVVSGKQDVLLGYRNSRLLAEALCGRWLHYGDAGHGVAEQYADEVNAAIEQTIKQGEERAKDKPFIVSQRKPMQPDLHPLQVVLTWLAATIILSRKGLLGRFLSPRMCMLISTTLMGCFLRRRFGGFFAR